MLGEVVGHVVKLYVWIGFFTGLFFAFVVLVGSRRNPVVWQDIVNCTLCLLLWPVALVVTVRMFVRGDWRREL